MLMLFQGVQQNQKDLVLFRISHQFYVKYPLGGDVDFSETCLLCG